MFDRKTVLVVDAGASKEFNLPAGNDLAAPISKDLNWQVRGFDVTGGNVELFRGTLQRWGSAQKTVELGRLISEGLPLSRSIDDFLFNHGANEDVVSLGKLAIVRAVLRAESNSRLALQPNASRSDALTAFHRLHDTWAYKLYRFLVTGIKKEYVKNIFDNLYIINFNYDRCLEIFFAQALRYSHALTMDEAVAALRTLQVFRPYGAVGRLPWQPGADAGANFGEDLPIGTQIAQAEGIKTFTDSSHSIKDVELWRSAIHSAEQIIFLGFGFHKQNMELLDVGQRLDSWPDVYATAFGTSDADRHVFSERISWVRGLPPVDASPTVLCTKKCNEFIDDYGLRLTS